MSSFKALTSSQISRILQDNDCLPEGIQLRIVMPGGCLPRIDGVVDKSQLVHGNVVQVVDMERLIPSQGEDAPSHVRQSLAKAICVPRGQRATYPHEIIFVRDGRRVGLPTVKRAYRDRLDVVSLPELESLLEDERCPWRRNPDFRPNVLNNDDYRRFIEEAVANSQASPAYHKALGRMVRDNLDRQPEAFDALTGAALRAAAPLPDWVSVRRAAGETIYQFDAEYAQDHLDYCQLFDLVNRTVQIRADTRLPALADRADRLMRGLSHHSASTFCSAADDLASEFDAARRRLLSADPLFEARREVLGDGYVAVRLNSIKMLADLGEEAGNCMAPDACLFDHHAEQLERRDSAYWALRSSEQDGDDLVAVVQVGAGYLDQIGVLEIKGPHNRPLPIDVHKYARCLFRKAGVERPSVGALEVGAWRSYIAPARLEYCKVTFRRRNWTLLAGDDYLFMIRTTAPRKYVWFHMPAGDEAPAEWQDVADLSHEADVELGVVRGVLRKARAGLGKARAPTLRRFVRLAASRDARG